MAKFKDMSGQTFGRLTALERFDNNKHNHTIWLCRCICGKEVTIAQLDLARGKTKSCGCLNLEKISERSRKNIAGHTFGRLTAIEYSGSNKQGKAIWKCKCSCGKIVNVVQGHLASGDTKSCGYLQFASNSERQFLNKLEPLLGETIVRQLCIQSSKGRRYYDGYIPSKNLLIEVDSERWHTESSAISNDEFKDSLAKKNGYKLFRVIVNTVEDIEMGLIKTCSFLKITV